MNMYMRDGKFMKTYITNSLRQREKGQIRKTIAGVLAATWQLFLIPEQMIFL